MSISESSIGKKVIVSVFTLGEFPGTISGVDRIESDMQFGDETEYDDVYIVTTDAGARLIADERSVSFI